ncbi:MAG: efflux transporter outer membrane subunit [Candidatus Electrothrix scaldis]|nr:MAG: efflux transporter outer membrane subunit [Candidatus Electrothrix sp. GW3-3]
MQALDADQSAQQPTKQSSVQSDKSDYAGAGRKSTTYLICTLVLCGLVVLAGCQHQVQSDLQPGLVAPKKYSRGSLQASKSSSQQWWQSLEDPQLAQYIEEALQGNFTLKEGAARLKQAGLLVQQKNANRYPTVEAGVGLNADFEDSDLGLSESLGFTFSWEADLWGRLAAARQAAFLDAQAEQEALAELSLAVSVEIAETYYELIEQNLLYELLQSQLEADTTAHDLVKLRFANGAVSSSDVLQQEELLASVRAQFPPIQAQLVLLRNRLLILQGHMPESKEFALPESLPQLSPLPPLGIPADLLLNRPDLRKLRQEVAAADSRVAEAVADRLPSLKLGGSAGLSSGEMVLSLFAEALATVLDWDQKKNEVKLRKAKVEEKTAAWSQAYLEAVEEVENSLTQEQEQSKLLLALQEQLQVAEALLEQTRNRYLHGVTDYLPVLTALVSVQNLERSLIQQQRLLLSYRLQLYHALGGSPL